MDVLMLKYNTLLVHLQEMVLTSIVYEVYSMVNGLSWMAICHGAEERSEDAV